MKPRSPRLMTADQIRREIAELPAGEAGRARRLDLWGELGQRFQSDDDSDRGPKP